MGIDDESALRSRKFRNHFEHYDERLEKWLMSSERHNYIDSNIGPIGSIPGFVVTDYIRNFDPTTWTLTFRGDRYELAPVLRAVKDLLAKCHALGEFSGRRTN